MPRNLFVDRVLVEVDAPEVVLGRDAAGATYLAMLAERTDTGGTFLCIALSGQRLTELWTGKISLRDAFLNNENGEAFAGTHDASVDGRDTLACRSIDAIPEKWLPGARFRLPLFLPGNVRAADATCGDAGPAGRE